jgi:hypothetical protein
VILCWADCLGWWDATESGPRGMELVWLGQLALSFCSALQKRHATNRRRGGCQWFLSVFSIKHVIVGRICCVVRVVGCYGVWAARVGGGFVGAACVEFFKRPA